jgi:bacillithiol system protein YtxJ
MNWIPLISEDQIPQIADHSQTRPQVLFKHSTRCSLSSIAWNRIGKTDFGSGADYYFLDIIRHRSVSNKIAETFSVHHESPQLLVIRNGECVFEESHMGIRPDKLLEELGR